MEDDIMNTHEQLRLLRQEAGESPGGHPEKVDDWQLACGRLVRGARSGCLRRSLTELGRAAGVSPARLRDAEKLAERTDGNPKEGRWTP